MTAPATAPAAVTPLANERCDRCSAAAKLRMRLVEGGELIFCGHHANKYAETIVRDGVEVQLDVNFDWRGKALIPAA